jgi:hypothetical protein
MSTQVLGDVELVTKQELEAALDAVVVPEDEIDTKITNASAILEQKINSAKTEVESEVSVVDAKVAQEMSERTAKDVELADMIHDEADLRETTDDALRARIEREEGVRGAADEELTQLISQETEARKEADEQVKADIMEEIKLTQSKVFEDTVFCSRMKNLPLAQMTIEVLDRTITVGDIIGTVDAEYIPASPLTVSFIAELSDDKSYHIAARVDATGNVIVISKTELAEVYAGNVNSVTVMYITKE